MIPRIDIWIAFGILAFLVSEGKLDTFSNIKFLAKKTEYTTEYTVWMNGAETKQGTKSFLYAHLDLRQV